MSKIDISNIDKKYFIIVPLALLILILPTILDRCEQSKRGNGNNVSIDQRADEVSENQPMRLGDGENVIIVDHKVDLPDRGSEKRNLVVALWRGEHEALHDATKEFERRNQNVQVIFKEVDFEHYMDNIGELVNVRGDIDVFLTRNASQYAKAIDNEIAMDIDQEIRLENIEIAKYGRAFESLRVNGRFYGLPYKRMVYILFYNKNIFDMAGIRYPTEAMTWQEYRQHAAAIREKSGSHRIFGAFVDTKPQSWYIKAVQMGGELLDPEMDKFESAMEYRKQLELDGSIRRYALQERLNMHFNSEFQRGETGMHVSGSWHINQLLNSSIGFDWGVASAPYPQNAMPDVSIGNYSLAMISKTAREFDIAFNYIKFLASRDGAVKLAENLVLPGYMDDKVLDVYVQNVPRKISGLKNAVRQNFFMEYPVVPNGSRLANEIFYEEARKVFLGSSQMFEFSENIRKRKNEMDGYN